MAMSGVLSLGCSIFLGTMLMVSASPTVNQQQSKLNEVVKAAKFVYETMSQAQASAQYNSFYDAFEMQCPPAQRFEEEKMNDERFYTGK